MRIFLSYTTQDFQAVDKLQVGLKLRRSDLDIYFAPKRNEVGAYWLERLGTELEAADALILLIGRRIGPWQELEYYDALKRNRKLGRPVIAPILLAETAPGLPFFDQFHRLSQQDHDFDQLIDLTLKAIDGAKPQDNSLPWQRINPYPGLSAMGTDDAAYFFGREKLTGQILNRLENYPDQIQALIGNSGVGKSSLAMAGVLSALRSRLWPGDWDMDWPSALRQSHTWPIVVLKPGETPVNALAQLFASLWLESPADIEEEALKWRRLLMGESSLSSLVAAALKQLSIQNESDPPQRLVVYVDQAEELYSRAEIKEARRFSQLLAEAVLNSHLLVILSLRSDYYGHLQDDTVLFNTAETIDVPPMDKKDIERVIRLPAERLKARFDNHELIPMIADATAREPGAMPMLSDILSDAWHTMMNEPGTEGVLHFPFQVVDISRPLAEKAERFFVAQKNRQDVLKKLFTLKLAYITKEGEVVRRRISKTECSEEEWLLIEAMAERDWRLVSTGDEFGEAIAEVAHEALLRNWPRLSQWLDESREFLIWKGQLEPDRITWEQADNRNRTRALLSGLRLDKALYWQNNRLKDLTESETRFIADSAQAATRIAQQRVWVQRVLVGLLIGAVGFAGYAYWQRNAALQAEKLALQSEQKAKAEASLAEARRLAILAEKTLEENIGETTLAGLLAVESLKRTPTQDAKRILRRFLQLTPNKFSPVKTPWPHSKILHSPDGKLTAFYRLKSKYGNGSPAAGKVSVLDRYNGTVSADYKQQGRIWPVISKDGTWMALNGYGRRLQVIDLKKQRIVVDDYQDDMIDVAFGSTGQLFVARTDGKIEIRTAPEWQKVGEFTYPIKDQRPDEIQIKTNENNHLLLLARGHHPYLIAADTGKLIELKGHQKSVMGGVFIPGGKHLATWAWGGELFIRDAITGGVFGKYQHEKTVSAVTSTSAGQHLISADEEGHIIIRNIKTGNVEKKLKHDARVNAIAVSTNGKFLASASDDKTAAIWDLQKGEKLLGLPHKDEVWTVAFDVDDAKVITGGKEGILRVFDFATGKQQKSIDLNQGILSIARQPNSGALIVATRETDNEQAWADMRLVDRKTGNLISEIEHNGGFSNMVFSPDGGALAALTGGSGALKIWNTDSGQLRVDPNLPGYSIFFTPDSRKLVSGKYNRETVILDAQTGNRLAAIGEPGGIENVIVSDDGKTITTFGIDKSFKRWDAITGELLWQRQSRRPNDSVEISANALRFADRSADGNYFEIGELLTGEIIARIPAGKGISAILSEDGLGALLVKRYLPNQKYSEIELWDVKRNQQLLKQKYQFRLLRAMPIPGNRFAVIARFSTQNEPKVILDVFQAGQGKKLWSTSVSAVYKELTVSKQRHNTLALSANNKTQFFDIATGKPEVEVNEKLSAVVVNRKNNFKVLAKRESLSNFDYLLEIRNNANGKKLKEIPVQAIIRDITVSRDGKRLFAAITNDYINGVKVWSTQDWTEIGFIQTESQPEILYALTDSDLIAVQNYRGTFRIWQVSTGKEAYRLWHTVTADKTQFASVTNRIATVQDGSIRLWDAATGNEIAHHVSQGGVNSFSISPDGRIIAYISESKKSTQLGGDYKPLTIWKPDSKDDPIHIPMQSPNGVLFSPLGKSLAVIHGYQSHGDHKVQVMDTANWRTIATIRRLPGSAISDIKFSLDGKLLLIKENKRLKSSQRVFSLQPFREITRIDDIYQAEFVANAPNIISEGKNGDWYWWDPKSASTDDMIMEIPVYTRLQPVKNSEYILGHDSRGSVVLLDTLQHVQKTVFPKVENGFVRSVAINKERSYVAVAFDHYGSKKDSGQVVIQGIANHKELARLHTGVSMPAMVFVNDGDSIVMHDYPDRSKQPIKSVLRLWNWSNGNVQELGQDNLINAISVSPDGLLFATAEGSVHRDTGVDLGIFQVRIWNAQSGNEIKQISQSDVVHDVSFSPDGQFLAVRVNHDVLVYQKPDWTLIQKFALDNGTIARPNLFGGEVQFGIENRIVVRGQGNTTRVWSLDGQQQLRLRHKGQHPKFKLSGNGRYLAIQDKDGLKVWDIVTGKEQFRAHLKNNDYVFAGQDGETLFANVDRKLMRIRWKSDELIAEACQRLTRNMSEDEWSIYFDQQHWQASCKDKALTSEKLS